MEFRPELPHGRPCAACSLGPEGKEAVIPPAVLGYTVECFYFYMGANFYTPNPVICMNDIKSWNFTG